MCTDLILEEAAIRLLDPLGEVREEGEAGYRRGELHDVLDLDVLALGGRRRRGLLVGSTPFFRCAFFRPSGCEYR